MDPTAKQQIVERVKQATNVLITVNSNPSVDQLAACIGLTLLLNKLDKHATAVFSGKVPSTLEFLEPEKTLEQNTDSLRDFIISLDKSKADKLRYKVEDEVVRIFITPYRTSITDKDLVFSQGDFNVEVVIGLGVRNKDQLDAAIAAHGRILHDALVVSVNAGEDSSADLGSINWNEPTASSLSEMIVSISESFGSGLIDNQMATAFLTGIVAETERFSNQKTSPKVMTMSAQLMAAGANQQLIASKLQRQQEVPLEKTAEPVIDQIATENKTPQAPDVPNADGLLSISHDHDQPEHEADPHQIHIDDQTGTLRPAHEVLLEQQAAQLAKQPQRIIAPLTDSEKMAMQALDVAQNNDEKKFDNQSILTRKPLDPLGNPSRGGTLTANSRPEEYGSTVDAMSLPLNSGPMLNRQSPAAVAQSASPEATIPNNLEPTVAVASSPEEPQGVIAPALEPKAVPEDNLPVAAQPIDQPVKQTLSQLESEVHGIDSLRGSLAPPVIATPQVAPVVVSAPTTVEAARDAVASAVTAAPFNPAQAPIQSLNAQPLGQPITHQDLNTLNLPGFNPVNAQPSAVAMPPMQSLPAVNPAAPPPVPPPIMPPFVDPNPPLTNSYQVGVSLPPPQAPTAS